MTSKFATKDPSTKFPFIFDWEENFDYANAVELFNTYWWFPWVMSCLVYLPLLRILEAVMRNREPLKLKIPLILWNGSLATFSVIGFFRIFPELMQSLNQHGFYHSVCNNSFKNDKASRYWICLFVLSKTPELVDTIFLCLKKQKLIFLHVYHHASVLVFAWYIFAIEVAGARWFCAMNFAVHAVMYSYYVLKSLPNLIRIPKWVSMAITLAQTLQMVAGGYVAWTSYMALDAGKPCNTTKIMSISGMFIYLSYLVLFSHFFYKAYLAPRPPREQQLESGKRLVKDKKQV